MDVNKSRRSPRKRRRTANPVPCGRRAIPGGKITALIGANGSGKSTLLRALGRIIQPLGGAVTLDGKEIATMHMRTIAQIPALLPQSRFRLTD